MIASAARMFATKWHDSTPRERAGLAVLAAIVALTALFYAVDWAGARADAARVATQTAADRQALLTGFQDERYRLQLSTGADQVWRWSRAADPLAIEEVLAELESLTAQAGFGETNIALIETAEDQRGQVNPLLASISADFDWASFIGLLEAIEGSELSIAVRSVDVSETGEGQRVTITVAAPLITTREAR